MQNATLSGLSLLILEDDALLRKQIATYLERLGADVTTVDAVSKARQVITDLSFDFAVIDVNLPDGLGTDLLRERVFQQNTGVIVMTAEGGVAGAVDALKLGALEYLSKPFELAELPILINRARRTKQNQRIEEHRRKKDGDDEFLFGSALADLQAKIEKIIASDRRVETHLAPVLIQGETGTGKTTIARWIHRHGPRSEQPLVEVNCSALPETLAESELFGHERGAFTDARAARIGLFEAAHGGTLFLDELPSLSLALQAKVLTAVEDHKIRRVGGSKEIPVDVRIIAATNRILPEAVSKGEFREDLYHRLDLFSIDIPPLRERGDDIMSLAEMFLETLAKRHRVPRKSVSAAGRKALLCYPWPGNVRELAHELERAIVFDESNSLDFESLSRRKLTGLPTTDGGKTAGNDWFNEAYIFPPDGFSLEEGIMRMINHALKQTNQNVSAAARLLGVSRDYLRYRLSGRSGGENIPMNPSGDAGTGDSGA
ncbi:MAG TPA: sigma-54 dependent transcriptional regulator [Candidatus Kapabacteria bacterium]|nr:sigma-54 dependent transcriptional regulator [Candidatus Kapabacteria bacterium]